MKIKVNNAPGRAQAVRGLERSPACNPLRLRVDGKTYLQRVLNDQSGAELYALRDDTTAETVAETSGGEFWFLGRVRRAPE